MTQKEIMDALQKSLVNGTGSLDDLGNLLARVQIDIEQAKKEEAENKRKAENARGERIASIATRMLAKTMTNDDMAFIFNEYFDKSNGQWTAKDIQDIKDHADKSEQAVKELDAALGELANALQDVFRKPAEKSAPQVKSNVDKNKNADDVLKKFLKDFGLA